MDYEYVTTITDGKERYSYFQNTHSEQVAARVIDTFPESLLTFLYMDLEAMRPIVNEIIDDAKILLFKRDIRVAEHLQGCAEQLPVRHPYFRLTQLFWANNPDYLQLTNGLLATAYFASKDFATFIPKLIRAQRECLDLIEHVLDIDNGNQPVGKRLTAYYMNAAETKKKVFAFRPLTLNYELMDHAVFSEVLHPKTAFDLIDYHMRECIKREVKLRKCKNCGRYFSVTGHLGTEYCARPTGKLGKTCREVGASRVWAEKQSDDIMFTAYRREYKKRFARTRAGTLTEQDFHVWSEAARAKKRACEHGELSRDVFFTWLKNS